MSEGEDDSLTQTSFQDRLRMDLFNSFRFVAIQINCDLRRKVRSKIGDSGTVIVIQIGATLPSNVPCRRPPKQISSSEILITYEQNM